MNTAVVAVDATRDSSNHIRNLCQALIRFQAQGLLTRLHLTSVIHPDSFLIPHSYFHDQRYDLAQRAAVDLKEKLDPRLRISSSKLLITVSQSMEEHIASILLHGRESGAEMIVTGTSERTPLSYLLQGSFAESLSLHSPVPVMVMGKGAAAAHNSRLPSILVAFSPNCAPTAATRAYIVKVARALNASVLLLPYDDQCRWWATDRKIDRETAESIRQDFRREGLLAVRVRRETVLIGEVAPVADQVQAWLTIFCSTPLSERKPRLSPSLNGRLITDMERPVLILKDHAAQTELKAINQR